MDTLIEAICKLAIDDTKWEDAEQVKTAAPQEGGGFNLDPRTLAMAMLGAGGMAGGGALSGQLSGKQLALLGLLGAAAGGGGNELYKYLQGGQGGEPAAAGDDDGSIFDAVTPSVSPSLSGATGGALLGVPAGAGLGSLSNLVRELGGQSQRSIRSVLTAPDDAEASRRLRNFLVANADLQQRLGTGDVKVPSNEEIQNAARSLRSFAQERGINPNDPRSIRDVEQALRAGNLDIDYEGPVPQEIRQQLEAEQTQRFQLEDLDQELSARAQRGQLSQPNLIRGDARYEVPSELLDSDPKTYDDLRNKLRQQARLRQALPRDGTPDLSSARARGRVNMLTGEIPDLDVGGRSFRGVKVPGAFDAISTVRNRLNEGPGFKLRRFMPSRKAMGRGALAGGAALGALGGLLRWGGD